MRLKPRSAALGTVAAIGLLAYAGRTDAQYLTRPARAWETIETARFRIHYPADMRAWVLPVAQRMESYAAAVNLLVEHTPAA
ncbi:MAG: hypothetical protein Q8K82_16045, partial [Gemmatimonadaceae bacterium]|nr:hypothetical protein [Gemmatimonadaceae bacterium]